MTKKISQMPIRMNFLAVAFLKMGILKVLRMIDIGLFFNFWASG